jgi:transposase-like protein
MAIQKKQSTEAAVREIRRRSRRKFSPEEKIRIVFEGLRGEQSVSDLCRREGIASNLYYRWSKDFLEAGKKQLASVIACGSISPGSGGNQSVRVEPAELVATEQSGAFERGRQREFIRQHLGI